MADEVLRLSETQEMRVSRSDSDVLELEATWQQSKPPPTHWHPHQREHFEVLDGALTVRVSDSERVYEAGESFDIPPRTAHAMWNAESAPCRATWLITPALRTEQMFRTITSGPGIIGKLRMLRSFRNEFRLGSPRG